MPEAIENENMSARDLLVVLRRSELVPDEMLKKAVRSLDLAATSAEAVAAHLIEKGLITSWQSKQLLKARWRGYRLGKYTLLNELGRGGMAKVFKAQHQTLGSYVAIKVLSQARTQKQSMIERFMREARAAAQLSHAHIVRVTDVDTDENRHYLVMEYIDGNTIQGLVDSLGVLSYDRAARFTLQAAEALACAHNAGMIHRDIKPANLLVEQNQRNIKISDFGLALVGFGEDDERPSLTMQHDEKVLGTADYIAPEQAVNSHNVDPRADLYSLGYTLYFMLTGQPPFPTGRIVERLTKHCTVEPEGIKKFRPDAPQDLLDIVHRMTRKTPHQRYKSAEECADALQQWLHAHAAAGGSSLSIRNGSALAPIPSQRTSPSSSGGSLALAEGSMVMPVPADDDDELGLAPEEDVGRSSVGHPAAVSALASASDTSVEAPVLSESDVVDDGTLSEIMSDVIESPNLSNSPATTESDTPLVGRSGSGDDFRLAPATETHRDTQTSGPLPTLADDSSEPYAQPKPPFFATLYAQISRGEYPLWLVITGGVIMGAVVVAVLAAYLFSFLGPDVPDRFGE